MKQEQDRETAESLCVLGVTNTAERLANLLALYPEMADFLAYGVQLQNLNKMSGKYYSPDFFSMIDLRPYLQVIITTLRKSRAQGKEIVLGDLCDMVALVNGDDFNLVTSRLLTYMINDGTILVAVGYKVTLNIK